MKDLKKIRKEVNLIKDGLDMPVDEGIKELVIGLHYCGIKTESSCEGHANRASQHPWVMIPNSSLEKLLKVVLWQNRPNGPDGKENKNNWVIKPKLAAISLLLMPEDKGLPLEQLQRNAEEFGLFLQKLSPDWFPKGWFEK